MTRTPPRWFVTKLRGVDRTLDVRWVDARAEWDIGEWVLTHKKHGRVLAGAAVLHQISKRWNRVFSCKDVGSAVLDYVRRLRINRFDTTDTMVRELRLDETQEAFVQ